MFGLFKKSKKEDDIVVLSKPGPAEGGGTYATLDKKAPKEIISKDIVFFSVTSRLPYYADENGDFGNSEGDGPLTYISAFAARGSDGTFVYLETERRYSLDGKRKSEWAYVMGDVLSELSALVIEENLAENNGYNSFTGGLPENFGGKIEIKYASGESINTSDNHGPVISFNCGTKIVSVFDRAMKGERAKLPELSSLEKICFESDEKDGGFTHASLTILPDGTAVNEIEQRFDESDFYQSKQEAAPEKVATIKKIISENGLFAWPTLPVDTYISREKYITFFFDDGKTIKIKNERVLPHKISNGFFKIELEMTT